MSDNQTMSDNPIFGHVSHPEAKSNAGTGSTSEEEPINLNVQTYIKSVKHNPWKENPAATSQLYKSPKDISLLKKNPTCNVVATPGRTQLPQIMDKSHPSSLPRSRYISNSIDGEEMKRTSMHSFRFTLNQLLQGRRKPAEFNGRVPKPKGPRPPPAAWDKTTN